ncbi:hypothetical protein SAPIO_CDS5351 [Scedosporium apiospermum]|uniref:Branched-chain-amino-acid aminotransferase-like protein 2 n=1 Tax=Pseudallescheria apiosperma TaxID=563466 RepID=A0A084G6E9_PSEDA|nr:uncharacterized protein SAPIO_CDS5351 [Scedosporium apiospermum]KEZ42911.1 hypothetical protein SAPIO_CDS5351 [Scedosporium apiospermum]
MTSKPIFAATHPRACSTAFERVFMTCRDTLECVHEPFGDAFYFGPERMSERFENDEAYRAKSGFANTTYADVLGSVLKLVDEGKKQVFIKDIAYYLLPPDGKPAKIPPSLAAAEEPKNPTVIPLDSLRRFQFTFLIRHPRRSIPSYYRCTVPPLDQITNFDHFMPNEAGYDELRRLFDYLIAEGVVDRENLVVLDADDMLDNPEGAIKAYCERVGIAFSPNMLNWSEDDTVHAAEAFEKWNGFHNDAISSSSLKPRTHAQEKKNSTSESEDEEWRKKYGEEAQKVIRKTVEANIADYEYLKQFALKVPVRTG